MIRHDCKQNSEEWHRLRLGIPTASCFDRIITPKTWRLSKSSASYMYWLLAEWMVGAPLENPETAWMQRGTDLEPEAVRSYEFETDRKAEEVGIITTDDGMVGASPDRLVGDDGLLEIKCPSPQVHVGYMVESNVDDDYRVQLQGQLWIAERQWVDIQSYCPGLPTVIIRVERDEKYIRLLESAVLSFVSVMLEARSKLLEKYGEFRRQKPRPVVDDFGITDEDLDLIIADRFRQKGGAVVPEPGSSGPTAAIC